MIEIKKQHKKEIARLYNVPLEDVMCDLDGWYATGRPWLGYFNGRVSLTFHFQI